MLELRVLTIALWTAGVALLIGLPLQLRPVHILVTPPAVARPAPPPVCMRERGATLSVVDVAAGIPPSQLLALIRLAPDEFITSIDDREVSDELAVRELLGQLSPRPGGFVDFTVSTRTSERRVLLLQH